MQNSIFSGVKQWDYKWNDRDLKLPVFFHENTIMSVAYTASTKEVKKLLPLKKMKPIEIFPGRCLVAISAIEYRKSDLGKYNEAVISFPITFDKPQIPLLTMLQQLKNNCYSSYIWQLPVTEEWPRQGGVELFGYPKFIADISFSQDKDWLSCTLKENDELILSLRGRKLSTKKGKTIKYVGYTMLDNLPLVTNSQQNNQEYAQSSNKKHSSLELGTNHPISKSLEKLKLGRNPFVYQYSPKNELILFPMRNLIDN